MGGSSALKVPPSGPCITLQMPEDERGHKQLGRAHALSHLAQLGLTLLLGILVMAEPWPTASAWRAVYGGFGILYALQVSGFPIGMQIYELHASDRARAMQGGTTTQGLRDLAMLGSACCPNLCWLSSTGHATQSGAAQHYES